MHLEDKEKLMEKVKAEYIQINWLELLDEHLLQSKWAFWYNSNDRFYSSLFANKLIKIGLIETIEDFFRAYVYLKKPSELSGGSELRFFREGIIPMWEYSPDGGCFVFKNIHQTECDKKWEKLLFCCIGEGFSTINVSGVVLSVKKDFQCVLQIWLKSTEETRLIALKKIMEILNIKYYEKNIYYKEHHQSMIANSTISNLESCALRPSNFAVVTDLNTSRTSQSTAPTESDRNFY